MKLLLLILSTVMSWFVTTKNTVSGEGSWPNDMTVTYRCTYQKGDVRQGDTATISFTHLDGVAVASIEVYVKSNKSAGAGTFTLMANNEKVTTKSGTFKDWTGAYDNSEYHAISLLSTPLTDVDNLSIELVGAANSIHIEKYVIEWGKQANPHTVTLMNGSTQYEVLNGTEVVLPALEDLDEWHFIGWTKEPFYVRNEYLPSLIPAGKYKATDDITLWAVYDHKVQTEQLIATDLQDGVYQYATMVTAMAMCDGVLDGTAGSEMLNLNALNQCYEVTFDSEGMATIQLMYVYGEEFIGFSGKELANEPSKWHVYHSGQKTAFYTMVENEKYMLMPGMWSEKRQEDCTQLIKVSDITQTTTVLIHADMSIQPYLTCYPEVGFDVKNVSAEGKEYILPIGNYLLRIKDGKKQLEKW